VACAVDDGVLHPRAIAVALVVGDAGCGAAELVGCVWGVGSYLRCDGGGFDL